LHIIIRIFSVSVHSAIVHATATRLWCWCGSVLTVLLPATSPNSAFLLPLLQVVSISGQPRRAYYKFPGPELRSAGRASLSRDHVEQSSCCCTETGDDSAHFQETTEGLSVPHLMCWRTEEHSTPPGAVVAFSRFWRRIQNCRFTYLLTAGIIKTITASLFYQIFHEKSERSEIKIK